MTFSAVLEEITPLLAHTPVSSEIGPDGRRERICTYSFREATEEAPASAIVAVQDEDGCDVFRERITTGATVPVGGRLYVVARIDVRKKGERGGAGVVHLRPAY